MSLHNVHNKKIVFVVPYPFDTAPGQRFRYEQYLDILKKCGYRIQLNSFLSQSTFNLLYDPGEKIRKFWGVLIGLIRRFVLLPEIVGADFIFIFREAAPVGPPVFEWIIAKIFQKKIIYDFDDAIWMTDKTNEFFFEKTIRWRSKVGSICRWSHKVSCGNAYLAAYAKRHNKNVVINPTTIDTEFVHNRGLIEGIRSAPNDKGLESGKNTIVIGWTGSHSTLKYLEPLEPVLQQLEALYPQLGFLVIADRKPELALHRLKFLPWNKETEAADLMQITIGIMPLPNDEWTKGKCGFKALQYMAMEIPCIISPVGVNTQIVEHGINGFLATTNEEWLQYLTTLVVNTALRKKIGQEGRKQVIEKFSVLSNQTNFLSLFE